MNGNSNKLKSKGAKVRNKQKNMHMKKDSKTAGLDREIKSLTQMYDQVLDGLLLFGRYMYSDATPCRPNTVNSPSADHDQ